MEQINLRIDPETRDRLQDLANHTERSMSAMVRWLVNECYVRTFKVVSVSTLPHPTDAEPVITLQEPSK